MDQDQEVRPVDGQADSPAVPESSPLPAEGEQHFQRELETLRAEVEQLQALLAKPPQISGAAPGESGDALPEQGESAFSARLREARMAGDTLAALKVKQDAARVGVVLL